MVIAVDFDGTIVENRYPEIGRERPFAIETLKMLIRDRHRLILWTCREGELLENAIQWCLERGVEFYAVNHDYPEETTDNNPHFTRKLKADLFIDDRNVGGLPDWGTIYRMVSHGKTWRHLIDEAYAGEKDYGESHHRKDDAARFKERSLNAIVLRRKIEKWLKVFLLIVAVLMVLAVGYVYLLGT